MGESTIRRAGTFVALSVVRLKTGLGAVAGLFRNNIISRLAAYARWTSTSASGALRLVRGTEARAQLRRYLILATLLYLRMTSVVLAQTATGVIRGTVEDLTGAVVRDVHVKLVDDARASELGATVEPERIVRIPGVAVRQLQDRT